jgi:CRISPR-associated protein Cas1
VSQLENLQLLPRFSDGLAYLYVEHAVIEQEARAIAVFREEGSVLVPVANLGVLALGPGTRITHAAIRALAASGVTVLWVGEEFGRFYAQGLGETRSARRMMKQAKIWANPRFHLEVVKRLYRFRFPEPLPEDLTVEQLRGYEGVRVRETYARFSKETGVPWHGRNYDRGNWAAADPVNRALSAASAFLYGVVHAAIVSTGYSPALGFIHVGKMLSFVYDVADLYKAETVIPAAFYTVAESELHVERRVRERLKELLREARILERAVKDLHRLFLGLSKELDREKEEDLDPLTKLWDPSGEVEGGVAYGGADAGEGEPEPEG